MYGTYTISVIFSAQFSVGYLLHFMLNLKQHMKKGPSFQSAFITFR